MLDISKYTDYWFGKADLDELNLERDIVQWQGLNNPELDDDFREDCRELLYKFDEAIRNKQYGDNNEWNQPAKSEHGWYLSSDDED
ncbi:MAG: hypothetical protein E7345_04720 [Clostridiales bacterium]|nr:hypothetical protein [Clostridiales bacterium]